jgi:hypothetical protein
LRCQFPGLNNRCLYLSQRNKIVINSHGALWIAN